MLTSGVVWWRPFSHPLSKDASFGPPRCQYLVMNWQWVQPLWQWVLREDHAAFREATVTALGELPYMVRGEVG